MRNRSSKKPSSSSLKASKLKNFFHLAFSTHLTRHVNASRDREPGKQGPGPLLRWAEAVVPHEQHKHTPIFLFGTAGLRRLSAAHQSQLLAGVRTILAASTFR